MSVVPSLLGVNDKHNVTPGRVGHPPGSAIYIVLYKMTSFPNHYILISVIDITLGLLI